MNKKQIHCDSVVSNQLPPQHTKYPWLIAQSMGYKGKKACDQIFYNLHNPLSQYRCRIPELFGKRIRACFHGWVIMCNKKYNNIMWSLWDPQTCNIIQLPPLMVGAGGDIYDYECCLSFPPGASNSIFLLTTKKKSEFIFCRLDNKSKKKLNWTEISYKNQLKSIAGYNHEFLVCPTYFNGKIYVLSYDSSCRKYIVINVDIDVRVKKVVINLIPLVKLPSLPEIPPLYSSSCFLKGSCDHLFFIYISVKKEEFSSYLKWEEIYCVYLYKLDMVMSMLWEKMDDLKNAMFIVDLSGYISVNYSPVFSSKLKGCIHFLDQKAQVIVLYSYDVRNKTITMSVIPRTDLSPTNSYSYAVWSMPGCRFEADYGESKCDVESKQIEDKYVLVIDDEGVSSFPFDIFELIMKFCVDVDYFNFRATCKQFAALHVVRWSNITEIQRFHTYSLASPWSMVLDNDRGIISITDPMLGNKYLIRTSQELVGDLQIHYSKNGWLLMSKNTFDLMFFNPFTSDIRKLPHLNINHLNGCCFSTAPTSPDCMVVAITTIHQLKIYIHFVSREQSWRSLDFIDYHSKSLYLTTFYGQDIYALMHGRLYVFRHTKEDDYLWQFVERRDVPYMSIEHPTNFYLTKSDQHLLLVSVDVFEKSVQVYKLNQSTFKLEKLKSLGKDAIYVSETTCLCIEATSPKMENKVYFHHSYSENGKILFYSLETGRFHTFDDDNMKGSFGDLFKHKRLLRPHAWIEPGSS